MKIQELRIGNLVYLVYPDGITHKVEITGILPDKVFFKGKSSGFSMYEAISPIPLTEEILLKCGFERRGVYLGIAHVDTVYWYSPENQILYIEYTDSPFLEDEGTRYPVSSPIKHLHTLMNAIFDLTGEELEVEL